ncbi:MAG: hypothetical protein R6U28_03965 [Cyclonatronaceae bacterium]
MQALNRILPVFLIPVLLLSFRSIEAQEYRAFGLVYDETETSRLDEDEMQILHEAGIRWLMLQDVIRGPQREQIAKSGFSLMVMVPEFFPIPYRLRHERFSYFERSDSLLRSYENDPTLQGFGLFAYGNWHEGSLSERLGRLTDSYLDGSLLFTVDTRPFSGPALKPFDGVVLMTRSAEQLERQMDRNPALAGILYAPEEECLDLRDFLHVLGILDNHRDLPVFFHRDWFFSNIDNEACRSVGQNPLLERDFAEITRFYSRVADARLANPPERDTRYEYNGPLFLLFIFWVVFAVYFRLNPLYRRSTTRFFLNYDFFVNDILMRRIRFTGDAAVVFLFSCIMSGIVGYAAAELFLDPVGRQALLRYTPLVSSDWTHSGIFFLIFFLVMALILAIQIAWLRIANNRHAHTSQIATFVLWPQHLNLVLASAGVIILQLYPKAIIVTSLLTVFLAITFISFFTSAYNMRRIYPTSPLYMVSTYALFILVTATVASWLVFGLDILHAWDLAASLSALRP